jgi:hypothetical protein
VYDFGSGAFSKNRSARATLALATFSTKLS